MLDFVSSNMAAIYRYVSVYAQLVYMLNLIGYVPAGYIDNPGDKKWIIAIDLCFKLKYVGTQLLCDNALKFMLSFYYLV